jgi:hypothetical protein
MEMTQTKAESFKASTQRIELSLLRTFIDLRVKRMPTTLMSIILKETG